jgi:hypothetical protein
MAAPVTNNLKVMSDVKDDNGILVVPEECHIVSVLVSGHEAIVEEQPSLLDFTAKAVGPLVLLVR